MHSVDVRSISKTFGDAKAVDDVSFSARSGELVVLLGPSGCGKSTLLRMIAGLEEPSSGSIEIEGRDVRGLTGAARGVAMVFQSYALFPHLTVADNITFGLSVRGVAKSEMAHRLDRVVALLGLEKLLARKPAQLSGGQQQRVALGRALIAEAPVCLLDEPLSNLDAQLRLELRREIRALQQRLGITMIYVTHDQSEAMSMADQVILMRAGKIEQHGSPAELYGCPASLFTARFIGSSPMNLIDLDDGPHGAVAAGGDGAVLLRGSGRGRVLGLRPEDIDLHHEGGDGRFHATVTAVEYLGAEAVVTCMMGERPVHARTRGDGAPPVGARVGLRWDAAAGHLFEADSGRRLPLEAFA
ncbi:ABC transporter ATP-binding protein [Rhodopseudomonas sp. B29]|uniref:ABC transporter ATP-binding protein n=1 Tax=Rhodopseudomonas sp. B29 TaxID=95607 RepID=UPI000346DC43|nr:ABC transporter ATP-binding protein [Rhodopseudomonas sp. B29]